MGHDGFAGEAGPALMPKAPRSRNPFWRMLASISSGFRYTPSKERGRTPFSLSTRSGKGFTGNQREPAFEVLKLAFLLGHGSTLLD
jgi:hypothetical protein